MRVIDRRRHPFFVMYNDVLDRFGTQMNPISFMVLAVLSRYANGETGRAWPRHEKICEVTGLHRNTVKRAIRQLIRLGLLDVITRRGASNIYILRDHLLNSAETEPTDPDCSEVDVGSDGPLEVHLNKKPDGPLEIPPQLSGDPPPPLVTKSDEKDLPTTTSSRGAAAGDELGTKNREGAELLYERGVYPQKADDLANRRDVSLIRLVSEHWDREAKGPKPVGPGLLADMCERPGAYGFVERDGFWHAPKASVIPKAGNPPPAKPRLTREELAAKVRAARAAEEAEDQRLREEFRNSPPLRQPPKPKDEPGDRPKPKG